MLARCPKNLNHPPKRSIFFLVVVLLCFGWLSPLHAQFHQVHIEPDVDHAVKLSLYSPSEGFVAFNNYIGYTTDSGRTYAKRTITRTNVDYSGNPVNLTFAFTINGVKAFDQNNIFVYGDFGLQPTILHSAD